jgi:hypothetical protein
MTENERFDYTVLLLFPGFGAERENAEQIIEAALEHLNTEKDEPGMRFAYPVFAALETIVDADEAWNRLDSDDSLAMMILHDMEEEERTALTRSCVARNVPVCHTIAGCDRPPQSRRRSRDCNIPVVFRKRTDNRPPAHTVADYTLTDSLDDDDEIGDRIGQLIAVMALGVMEHHWRQNPPHYEILE